ncbi:MAG: WbqC family protein [Bacteroides sp.]|nr:WbqC family protein [Bacteroides sp.]
MNLPSRFCPPAAYYRLLAINPDEPVTICGAERFDKRLKSAHRMTIADTRGPLDLTVPIAKPYGHTWATTAVSRHNDWFQLMWTTLESAYGRTPYFEFYADDFRPLLIGVNDFGSVAELNFRFDCAIRRALGLSNPVALSLTESHPMPIPEWQPQPYWQIRRDSLGFIPNLSILDLIFNLGPETNLLWR